MSRRIFLLACFSLLLNFRVQATGDTKEITENLLETLHAAATAEDSIKTLYNLYDISNRRMQAVYGMQLMQTAMRAKDYPTEMDLLMQLSILFASNDSILSYLLHSAQELPESDEKKECETFLQLHIITLQAKLAAQQQKERQQAAEFIKELENEADQDIFSQIRQLYTICIYLDYASSGIMYTEYLDQLKSLVDQLPPQLYALRSNLYTRAAIVHTANNNYLKAINADKMTLDLIKKLEQRYSAMGRIYRNYDINYYICYRRILSNYPGLTRKELDEYYSKSLEICQRNADVQNDRLKIPRIDAYYLFATKRYQEAIPYIQQCLSADLSPTNRRAILLMLRESAEIAGNNTLLLQALNEYNVLLEDYISKKSDEFFRELQIRYDVEELKLQNTNLQLDHQQMTIKNNRRILWIVSLSFVITIILLVIAINGFLRSRKLAIHLQHVNETLLRERDVLNQTQTELVVAYKKAEAANHAKSEFLHSMSHEIRTPLNSILGFSQLIVKKIPKESRAQLSNFASLVQKNTDYLATLINNILEISSIESDEITFPQTHHVSIHTLCQYAIDEIKGHVKDGVCLYFDSSHPDLEITTDRQHVEQVLVSLLSNAAKFTKQGSIILNYYFKGLNKLVFEITDTGIGIPPGKEELIFDRFVKLDSFSQGSGLGLYLSRQLAIRLGGELYVDQSYLDGARFCFTIPFTQKG